MSDASNTPSVPHREGVVEVYDHEGQYLGCMGRETWDAILETQREIDVINDTLRKMNMPERQRNHFTESIKVVKP